MLKVFIGLVLVAYATASFSLDGFAADFDKSSVSVSYVNDEQLKSVDTRKSVDVLLELLTS
jgi:hypothetical protein